jgi:oligopeptide transport system substrate-binding protein
MDTNRLAPDRPPHAPSRSRIRRGRVIDKRIYWLIGSIVLAVLTTSTQASEVIRRGLGPEPDSLDIHQAQGLASINVLRDLREGLVTFDAGGELVPGAAESWEVAESGLVYRFRIREDARWSNGDPVLAEDFVRGFRRALDPASTAATAGLLSPVANAESILSGGLGPGSLGIVAISERELQILLARRTPWFPEILAHPVSFPLHASKGGVDEVEVNGAYRLVEWTPNSLMRLEKNPHFHGASSIAVSTIEYYPIEQAAAELSRFRAGELDITETIPAGRYQWLQENLPGELRVYPYLGSFWLYVNLRHPRLGSSVELRRALALAINRDILTRIVIGAGEQPAYSLVPPGMEGYEPAVMPEASLSQEERESLARALFAESGAADSGPLRLQLRYNTSGIHRRMAVAVTAMWKQVLGVDTELFNEEWKVFVNNRQMGLVTEVFRGGWIADYADPASFLDLFRGDGEMNFTFFENQAFDALLDEARGATGEERDALLQRSEAILLQEMPAIPLYYYVSRHLVKPGVRGFVDNVRDVHLSRYLSLEQP